MDNQDHPLNDGQRGQVDERGIYGSFQLGGNEFALSVKHVQEVVNPPVSYSSLPLAPAYLLGLFNLRGSIIPVLDLAKLLKMPVMSSAPEKADKKIAILELRGHRIGVLFDGTGEVFKEEPDERNDFSSGDESNVIQGVFKKDSGQRLIQILDAQALFDLKSLPQATDFSLRGRTQAQRRGSRMQCISFRVGPARCALGIAEIREILKMDKITNSSLAHGNCVGAIDLRGETVPIVDFAAVLGYRDAETIEEISKIERRVIVIKIDGGLFGLLVDSVDSIMTYYSDDLRSFPALNPERGAMFAGCIAIEGSEDTLLLDSAHLFSNDEIQRITHGHSRLFKSRSEGMRQDAQAKGPRRTFITFQLEDTYAVRIGDVREIIDYPKTLLKPPGLPPACVGVLNLRGEMIVIADGRSLYGGGARDSVHAPKVLIFKVEGLRFGLVVDSVEAIRSFSDSDKTRLPELLYQGAREGLRRDLSEAIQVRDASGAETNFLILDPAAIAERVRSPVAA